jgi:hypothetical protein
MSRSSLPSFGRLLQPFSLGVIAQQDRGIVADVLRDDVHRDVGIEQGDQWMPRSREAAVPRIPAARRRLSR